MVDLRPLLIVKGDLGPGKSGHHWYRQYPNMAVFNVFREKMKTNMWPIQTENI
jgi:hypothetical protein